MHGLWTKLPPSQGTGIGPRAFGDTGRTGACVKQRSPPQFPRVCGRERSWKRGRIGLNQGPGAVAGKSPPAEPLFALHFDDPTEFSDFRVEFSCK